MTPVLAIMLGGIVAGLIALVVAVPVLRTRGIYLALATFALGQIVQATLLNLEVVGGAAGYPVTAFIRFPTIALFTAALSLVVALLFATRFGIAVTAVHDDERVAELMGLDVRAFQIAAFTLGSIIAGIGGGLYAHHFSFIEAQYFNIGLSITIVLYVLLGGTQTVLGPLIGAVVFTLLPGNPAWQRELALCAVRGSGDRPDGVASAGPAHRRADPAPARSRPPRATGGPMSRGSRPHDRTEQPILRLERVTKRFGGMTAIDDLSFDVKRGSRTALIGPNGAGKTTVFNIVTGVVPIDAGQCVRRRRWIFRTRPAGGASHTAWRAASRTCV